VLGCTAGYWIALGACDATKNCDTSVGPTTGSCIPGSFARNVAT
jgi:hypothetical protein